MANFFNYSSPSLNLFFPNVYTKACAIEALPINKNTNLQTWQECRGVLALSSPFPPPRRRMRRFQMHLAGAPPAPRLASNRRHHDSSPKGHIHESGLRGSSRVSRPSSCYYHQLLWSCCLHFCRPVIPVVPDRADSSSEDNTLSTQARNDSSVVSCHPN